MSSNYKTILMAWLTGYLSGFVASMPIGPINLTIINEGAQRGFRRGFLIGLGAVAMDIVYTSIAFAGFSSLRTSKMVNASLDLVSFILVLYLGIKFLTAKEVEPNSPRAERVEEKLAPHTAFMTGFIRVLCNPGVLLFWVALTATFVSNDWVSNDKYCKAACVGGIGMGAAMWFLCISAFVARSSHHITPRTLLRISQGSGFCLVVLAIIIGVRIVHLLAQRQPPI